MQALGDELPAGAVVEDLYARETQGSAFAVHGGHDAKDVADGGARGKLRAEVHAHRGGRDDRHHGDGAADVYEGHGAPPVEAPHHVRVRRLDGERVDAAPLRHLGHQEGVHQGGAPPRVRRLVAQHRGQALAEGHPHLHRHRDHAVSLRTNFVELHFTSSTGFSETDSLSIPSLPCRRCHTKKVRHLPPRGRGVRARWLCIALIVNSIGVLALVVSSRILESALRNHRAPWLTALPARQQAASPWLTALPARKQAVSPWLTALPARQQAASPWLTALPARQQAASPWLTALPARQRAASPWLTALPARQQAASPWLAASPARKQAVSPWLTALAAWQQAASPWPTSALAGQHAYLPSLEPAPSGRHAAPPCPTAETARQHAAPPWPTAFPAWQNAASPGPTAFPPWQPAWHWPASHVPQTEPDRQHASDAPAMFSGPGPGTAPGNPVTNSKPTSHREDITLVKRKKCKRQQTFRTPTLNLPLEQMLLVGDSNCITTMCLLMLLCSLPSLTRLKSSPPVRSKRTQISTRIRKKFSWCRILNTNRDVLVLFLLGAACLPVAHAADSVATPGHAAPLLTTIAAGIAAAATSALAAHMGAVTDDEDADTHTAANLHVDPHLETKEENTDDDKETKEERDPSLAGSAASTGGMSCGTCGITRAPTAFTLDQMNRGDAGRCNTCVLGRAATIQDGAWLGDPMGAPGFEKMYLKHARYKKQKWTRRATHARQQHAEGFLAHFKNVNGADLLGTGVIHSILEAILDHQYDVLCLVDIKANGRPLTGFTAAQVQQAITTWSSMGTSRDACPFHAKIAFDESGVLTGAGGVILIYRKQLRLPAFTADPHGRWLSAEFIGRKNKALHVIGAYAFPTAFSTLNPANRIIAESMNDNITQRMLHLPLPPRKRPNSSLCKESRQGFPLLMADTNSTFDNRDRAQGEQRTGTNNKWPARERALSAEKGTVDIPNKPKTKKYGTNGQDGPGSLAWELKHNGIVSVLRHIHPNHTGKGRDQLCTYRLSKTNMSTRWSLIDHICIHNTKAASKVNSVGIDAGNTIIPGSDHHGISISLKFKQIFGDTKRNIYKRPPSVMPAPEIPKFTPTEIQIITTHITTNTEWQSQLQKASEAALDPDLDAESARGKITELWFEICKVYQQAWESIIAKRNSQSTTHRARRHAPQKHLSALRALTRTLFDRTRGSLAAAVLDRKPAQLDSILTRTHDAWLTLHNVFERYGFKLNAPPKLSPSGKQSLAAVEQKYHTTAMWLSTNEVLYHDAIFALRDRVRALDQRAHAKWLGTRQSDFRCKQRRFLDSTFARAVDAVDLDYISVDPNPEHPSGIIDDPTQVKEAVGTFFHNWMEHMSCPNDTNECSHPAPAKRCKPPKLGGKWIESFKDETTRNRPAYRTVGQEDASRLTGQAQAAHRMAQTKANIQDHWADDVMAPWSATQVQDTARAAGIKDTRAGISGITARLITRQSRRHSYKDTQTCSTPSSSTGSYQTQ